MSIQKLNVLHGAIAMMIVLGSIQISNCEFTDDNLKNFTSNLTPKDRLLYYDWITIRNTFYFTGQYDIMAKSIVYYEPENADYEKRLNYFAWPLFGFTIFFGVCLLFYFIRRFAMQGCLGPKKYVDSYGIIAVIIIVCGLLIGIVFVAFGMFFSHIFQ